MKFIIETSSPATSESIRITVADAATAYATYMIAEQVAEHTGDRVELMVDHGHYMEVLEYNYELEEPDPMDEFFWMYD